MRRQTPIDCCVLLATVALIAPMANAQSRPTTGPSPILAAMQAAERNKQLKDLANVPKLSPARIDEVARLARDGDHLRILTNLPPADGMSWIDVPDLSGICTVMNPAVRRLGAPLPGRAAGTMPDNFLFTWFQYDAPGLVDASTTLQVNLMNVQVVRVTETPADTGTQVQLTEQRFPGAWNDAPGISLTVSDLGPNGPPERSWTASSFGDLCRRHPDAVARYLEPIFRDLHADAAVLTPDTPLAYEVFAAEVTVDPATSAKVRKLVAQLDADDSHDRDVAGDELRAMGPVAAVAVGRMKVDDLSPEQRGRTAAVLRYFRPVTAADARRLRDDVDFLLNCLNDPDPFVTRVALGQLDHAVGHPVAFDATLSGRPRRDAVWQLRGELAPHGTTRPSTQPS